MNVEKSTQEIFKEIMSITKNIGADVIKKQNKSRNGNESYKYSRTGKTGAKRNHKIFLYIHQRSKYVEILFDTGQNPRYPILKIDKKNITESSLGNWKNIPRRLKVKPNEIISGKYSYDDIRKLIKQSYRNLYNNE